MSHENGDDPKGEPKTYRDYQIAKNPRASKPEENDDPMDPAANFDGVGDDDWQDDMAKGLLEDLPDHMVKDADGRTPMETALDALGPGMVSKDTEPDGSGEGTSDLAWTREDIEQMKMSSEEKRLALLEDVRDRLDARPPDTCRPEGRREGPHAGRHPGDVRGHPDAHRPDARPTGDPGGRAGGRGAGRRPGGPAEHLRRNIPENGLEDSLTDVVAWLREQADDMEDPEERRHVTDALDRLPDTGGASA